MTNIKMMSKVEFYNGFWCVFVLGVTRRWIVQGEHLTRKAAEADLKSWR